MKAKEIGTVAAALYAGTIAFPHAARAQCNGNGNPPPPPPVTANYANQSFGKPPLTYYSVVATGAAGCNGAAGGTNDNGSPGAPGQPGATIDGLNTGLTIIGAPPPPVANAPSTAAVIGSVGGAGGIGGQAGPGTTSSTNGGNGGNGGNAGQVTVRFDANWLRDPATGASSGQALIVTSVAGAGGNGGATFGTYAYTKDAGNGGAGGNGLNVNLTASGSVRGGLYGPSAYSLGGAGGLGGLGDNSFGGDVNASGGNGGAGGGGGNVTVRWLSGTIATSAGGFAAASQGGSGGAGGDSGGDGGLSGGNGGAGGAGASASAVLAAGTVAVAQPGSGSGVAAYSQGGSGGNGGVAGLGNDAPFRTYGGNGGNGGAGGTASVTILGSVSLTGAAVTGSSDGEGVLVQSNGGLGGSGGTANGGASAQGGMGGLAGPGGSANLVLGQAPTPSTISTPPAAIRTNGNFSHGALVQSVGGGGGSGGNASFLFGGGGGSGQNGGDGGLVGAVATNASVVVSGPNSAALLLQSVGGGGGSGGDASSVTVGLSVAIGGNGGTGGDGKAVTVRLGPGTVLGSTNPKGGAGLLAQSIGGGGGAAGNAVAEGVGFLALTIGGTGGVGGTAGTVDLTNDGLVTTYGDHAVGVQGQSIGGGGGKGGAALSFVTNVGPTIATAVGGKGGSGGAASTVSLTNTGQITTYGADAYGVILQSIGGGGGSGGAAAARAVSLSPSKYIPAVSASFALGGSGGSGNTGGSVSLTNSGLITTAGDGAIGVMAQSIGGGGGTGGDSTASSYSNGPQGGLSVSLATSVGGTAGVGGTGLDVTLRNSGLIATFGQDAYGVFAQSIGGGGGTGGAGDATSSAGDAKFSFAASVGVGGRGGSGGDAGPVSLTNKGAITTRGDGSDAVYAQSIGGGGGTAGGGTASASGGNVALAVGVGGSGGAGGAGNKVTISNEGSIVTRGTDAAGIFAQSIGGGGGKGGKGGATAGGTSDLSSAQALFDTLSAGLNFGQTATTIGDGILQIGQAGENIVASIEELKGILSQPQAKNDGGEEGSSKKIDVQVNVGVGVAGRGGGAGDGAAANVTNTGQIVTFGAQSDAVIAQSIGGGGGKGGAATSVGSASDDTPVQASVSVGGGGGSGGNGGSVTLTNASGGTILTQGVLAMGMVAQSIGGGGGEGSIAGTVNGSLRSLGVGLGGSGGAGGDGGAVTVSTAGSITTTGKHGVAILAQSVGGGGGVIRTMSTDQTFDPSKLFQNPQGRFADLQGISIDLGGQSGAGGRGGPVQVNIGGPITTSGLGAHAVVAQSIGGGGGFVAGGQFVGPIKAGGDANRFGDGGLVKLNLQAGSAISTAGEGAYGILAQSIGGGGGVAGDPSGGFNGSVPVRLNYVRDIPTSIQRSGTGSGGDVNVALQGASIQTSGGFAHAVFAQSIGGGGGLVVQNANTGTTTLYRGSSGGSGSGGSVAVSLVNSVVAATGPGSSGIFAQSTGQSTGSIQISIDRTSSVTGGALDPNGTGQDRTQRDAAAIRILGGTGNTIINEGVIRAAGPDGYAILADSSRIQVSGSGMVSGDISIPSGGALNIQPGGVVSAPTAIDLGGGVLSNAGTLHVGGVGSVGRTVITGNLVQAGSGTIVVDIAPRAGAADLLEVRGTASLSGTLQPVLARGSRLRPGSSQFSVLTATGGVTQNGLQVLGPTPVVQYGLGAPDGNTVALSVAVDYGAAQVLQAGGLSSPNRNEVGRALNAIFAADATGLDPLAARLAGLPTSRALAASLDSLSGEVAASAQQTAFSAQQAFASTLLRHAVGEVRSGQDAPASYAVASSGPVAPPGINAAGMRVWVGGFGASNVLTGNAGQGSLHSQMGGGLLGVEKWFDADRMLGVSLGGGSIDFSVPDRTSSGHTTSINLAGYGLARFGDFYAAGALAYGNYAADLRRPGLGNVAGLQGAGRGSFGTDVLGARAELGWRRPVGGVNVTPFAALQVDHLWQSAFTESTLGDPNASGLALRFGRETRTSVPLTLGGRVDTSFILGSGQKLTISAELGWVHEFNRGRSVSAAFVAAPNVPFRALGVSASRDAAQAGFDARFALNRNVALLGNFTGRFSDVETSVSGFGGLQITW